MSEDTHRKRLQGLLATAMTRHYYHESLTALKSAVAAIPTL